MGSLIDVLAKSGKFKALYEAIKMSDLVEELRTGGPYTVLAPTDGAVSLVQKNKFSILFEDKELLRRSIKFLFLEGLLDSRSLFEEIRKNGYLEVKSLEGTSIRFTKTGFFREVIQANDASLITTDIPAENGIIHAIDRVLFLY